MIRILALFLLFFPSIISAESTDIMRSSGKINVVYGVILIIFVGIVFYLIQLDKKIIKLEKKVNNV
ncbi:MAG: CcmD family protein [Saprospiraceae bacterium]